MFTKTTLASLFIAAFTLISSPVFAEDDYSSDYSSSPNSESNQGVVDAELELATAAFRNSKSGQFFEHSYGYAIFPTIGKVGLFFLGGGYGQGSVFEKGRYVGDAEMMQITAGWQLGGQAFSQIIFFQDQRAFDEFTSGNFEFGAAASAVVVNAGIAAEASTKGTSATANAGNRRVKTEGQYYKGMAVFSIAKGGLMYEAVLAGQKFTFHPR
ncbi:MAG: hypothetical protein ISEC1_P1971 [Thiomicrorhabdus sp.]|nr:MAG: hypothetical protein ISEC1_P1971 [Thiomicrorhabdus sp.]